MATVLNREMYSDVEASKLLGVNLSTFRRWLDGAERRGKFYEPILRANHTGSRTVTWGEFVEADYLRQYRKIHEVSLQSLRSFVRSLRDSTGVPYPLAHHQPWVGAGRRLLISAQKDADLEPALWSAFEPKSGLVLLTAPGESYLSSVSFEGEAVTAVHPDGKASPVVIDPDVRFGSPHVRGISTESLIDAVRAGESIEALAGDFGLEIEEIAAAISFEARRTVPAA